LEGGKPIETKQKVKKKGLGKEVEKKKLRGVKRGR
jgi:hypothetical protein